MCAVLMRGPASKRRFLPSVLDETTILVNCGLHALPSTGAHIENSIDCFEDLIAFLADLSTVSCLKTCLRRLVVDDISQFYWELKASSKNRGAFVGAYIRLFGCLDQVRRKFGCNVVVTGWDKLFESGFNYNGAALLNGNLFNDVTYLPKEFLLAFDQVYYVFDEGVKRLGAEGWAYM